MNIAVLRGGHHSEHDVSIKSGQTIIDALVSNNTVIDVVISKDLKSWNIDNQKLSATEALQLLTKQCDIVVPVLHGPFGEDGTIQGALEAAGLPYIGSGVRASAIAMDKFTTNHMFSSLNEFNIPDFCAINAADPLGSYQNSMESIGFPLVLKPARGGSSFETQFVNTAAEAAEFLKDAKSDFFIAQKAISGMELTCGVVEISGKVTALEVIEIVPPHGSFFDYDAKYTPGASQEIIPARIEKNTANSVKQLSVAAHKYLGCSGITRSDFIVDDQDVVWYLETNTAPGMTATSLVPQELAYANIELADTVQQLCAERLAQ
ncbi:TPA: D-alanine--D-alanine ligase [Candidatus Saccharibacteria bacterium]|nr:D-alanine--D-alanine ligase [Candidatus Saccharibacteria bacterium]HIO88027.1 D-alanine--D-alanine ligase [Candidatus Saccharibacteria bacterium]